MERWKTISRSDSDFMSYLEGHFSKTHVALPMRSLNIGTAREEITFEILPSESVQSPSALKVCILLARPQTFAFSLGPMLAVLAYCIARVIDVHWPIALSSFFGVLLFHVSVNLFNDYGDHIKGQDRLRPRGGSRAIQNGWVRAWKVKRAAWTFLTLAALCGLPAIIFHFQPIAIVIGLALLLALEFAFQRLRLKARGLAEIMAFLLTGPLLTLGYSWAVSDQILLELAAMGSIFGAVSLMYFHSANFENIMTDSQAGASTWATRAGFDASKRFFHFTSLLVIGFSAVYIFLFEKDAKLLPVLFAQVLFLFPVTLRVHHLASPLSSQLAGLRVEAIKLCWITAVALIGSYAWIMAVARAASAQ